MEIIILQIALYRSLYREGIDQSSMNLRFQAR